MPVSKEQSPCHVKHYLEDFLLIVYAHSVGELSDMQYQCQHEKAFYLKSTVYAKQQIKYKIVHIRFSDLVMVNNIIKYIIL